MRRYCFVATAYPVRAGRVLLIKHKKLGLWLPPGGHIDEGETPDEAAVRELREETGLEADFIVPRREDTPLTAASSTCTRPSTSRSRRSPATTTTSTSSTC